jgi:hypothetical protein
MQAQAVLVCRMASLVVVSIASSSWVMGQLVLLRTCSALVKIMFYTPNRLNLYSRRRME